MPITCSQCSYVNLDQSGFCVRCGTRLQQTSQFGTTYASTPPVSPTSSAYPPPITSTQWPTNVAPPPPGTQMGTAQGLASIRRAFAGFGQLVTHHSWLLSGDHAQAMAIRNIIRDTFQQRKLAKLNVNVNTLTERGVLMEEREYVVAHRGISTVFVYVAPAGQDLYISRATTVLPSISILRVVLLGLMLFTIFFGPVIFQSVVGNIIASSANSSPFGAVNPLIIFPIIIAGFIFVLLYFPILVFLIFMTIRSFIHWLVEKDFWVYLRSNVLNDFQLDDMVLLEHITDDVVRSAVKQVGLDADKIVLPPSWYQPKRRIRLI